MLAAAASMGGLGAAFTPTILGPPPTPRSDPRLRFRHPVPVLIADPPKYEDAVIREAKERQERRAAKRAENQRRTLEGIERARLRIELNSELTGVI
jgi:hypothetical protein